MNPQLANFFAFLRRHLFASICTGVIGLSAATAWFLWQEIDELESSLQDRAKEG